jgi:hypothetical protein
MVLVGGDGTASRAAVAGMLGFGVCLALVFLPLRIHRYTDSLYYEAQKLQLEGMSQASALQRVFSSGIASPLRGRLPAPSHLVEYADFYRRRWTVPAIAAALNPLAGIKALRDASLLGWAVLVPLLFVLLRRQFSTRVSVVATVASMLLPPVLMWAPAPLVDSWGMAFLVAGLLCALLVRDDIRWLPVWFAVVLVGSFTRDIGLVLVAATGWLALRERSRRMAIVAATGAVASAPAPLAFSAPLRQNLAYLLNGSRIPSGHPAWGWIAARYPGALLRTLGSDLAYPFHVAFPYSALALAFAVPVGCGSWLLFTAARTPFLTVIRAATIGAVTSILLSPNYTELRLELVFLPGIATGLALLAAAVLPAALPAGGLRGRAAVARS